MQLRLVHLVNLKPIFRLVLKVSSKYYMYMHVYINYVLYTS